ncbi:MAG: formate/nitrite transporter family protein [Clostridium sp.]|nr:formate/nitrite transporter family protein [Clostridium sp.]
MYSKEINNLSHSAEVKSNLLKRTKVGYIVSAMLGSLFVSLGIMLIYSIGGILHHNGVETYKILMGASFGVALSLVLMAGGDLFTSNAMIMIMGALEKTITWVDAIKIWFASWIGNILGGIVGAVLFVTAGLTSGKNQYIGEFIVSNALGKIDVPAQQLIIKGILCNILVCLAVWMCYKLKEETAKILMIFWCLFTFITAGFEHSVANMSFLAMGYLIDSTTITLGGYAYNIILVSLGNFIGGVLFIGLPYYIITNLKKESKM